ncbi:procollagen-lysine,2-oxoglutarate 5-dioxygenase-like [Glossina fuscipes]|uniref:procollagen-lysine 5-dioxygenase n=1 Tax=Glossina fuscipes TaxID=7396 RepID=A0A8U0W666_9MUSC|nr:procollagen-lysine,2-oxoglutarate 5-dioxygenase-like [Glossina fuscipes]
MAINKNWKNSLRCIFLLYLTINADFNPGGKENRIVAGNNSKVVNVKTFTIADGQTDGYLRYIRSAHVYGIEVTPLAMNPKSDKRTSQVMENDRKIMNLLRDAIAPYYNQSDTLVLFTHSHDVIFTASLRDIVEKFLETEAKLLFSAEKFCWPDSDLCSRYPVVQSQASRFLNSGAFIGYAPQLYALLDDPIAYDMDYQLYFTKVFVNESQRENLGIKLDTYSAIFQNLNGAKRDIQFLIHSVTYEGSIKNTIFDTMPCIIHANGASKRQLNAFANYLVRNFDEKCLICQQLRIELQANNLPIVTLAIIADEPAPFFDKFLLKIAQLNYPKQKMHLFIYCGVRFHDSQLEAFAEAWKNEYISVKRISSTYRLDEISSRHMALNEAIDDRSDYIFFVETCVHIDEPDTLRILLTLNRQFISPVVSEPTALSSNFLTLTNEIDDIITRNIIGMWNVPYVSNIYLIKNVAFKYINYSYRGYTPDRAICESLYDAGIFLYINNEYIYGHLISIEEFDISVARPDFYNIFNNPLDWMEKYIHPNYTKQLEDNYNYLQPCPDVYQFAITTDAFCDDLIAIMEDYGKWSSGSHNDDRTPTGYEAVPTRDIHMKQVGLHDMWLHFLNTIIKPLQRKTFIGHDVDPAFAVFNIVVRYRTEEQPSLMPHDDFSTYTINMALNNVDIDFQGGGVHFLRYNCSITNNKKGWILMHPGSLSHFHEGLPITNGTRYIMISHIDAL